MCFNIVRTVIKMVVLIAKKGKEKKIKNFYPWLFKDEVDDIIGDPEAISKSGLCNLFSKSGEFLGRGLYIPNSRKIFKLLSYKDEKIDHEFFIKRIQRAISIRERDFRTPFYRLINAEADFIPGLIVDRYADYLVVQFRDTAIKTLENHILEALIDLLNPKGIQERSDFEHVEDFNFTQTNETVYGEIPDRIILEENNLKILVNLKSGQKTGFFYDQRKNRNIARSIAKKFEGETGLDLYCYTGGFALNMSYSGMNVIAIDKSKEDIELAKENAKINNLDRKITFLDARVEDFLEEKRELKAKFIVFDPPSLIKNKSEKRKAFKILSELIGKSLNLIDEGCFSFSSCAYNIDLELMIEILRIQAGDRKKILRVLNHTIQDIDHPWILQIPESLYLKTLWLIIEKEEML